MLPHSIVGGVVTVGAAAGLCAIDAGLCLYSLKTNNPRDALYRIGIVALDILIGISGVVSIVGGACGALPVTVISDMASIGLIALRMIFEAGFVLNKIGELPNSIFGL